MLRMFDKYGLSIPIPTNLVIRIPSLTRLLLPEKRTDYSRVLFASSYFAKAVGEEKVEEKDPFTNIPISLWVVMKLVDADVLNYDNELCVSNYHRQGTRLQPEVIDQFDQQWLDNYCLKLKKRKGYGGTEAYSPRLVALGKGSEKWTGTIPEFIHELVFASEDSPLNSRQFDGAVEEVLSHYDKATMYCDLKNGYVLKSQKGKKNQSVEQVVASTQQGLESKNVEHGVASTRKGKKKNR